LPHPVFTTHCFLVFFQRTHGKDHHSENLGSQSQKHRCENSEGQASGNHRAERVWQVKSYLRHHLEKTDWVNKQQPVNLEQHVEI